MLAYPSINSDAITVNKAISTPLKDRWVLAMTIGLAAVCWFVFLSGWLNVTPGSVMTKRQNILFNSDTNLWRDRMIGSARSPEHLIHPLDVPLWRPPCRFLSYLLRIFLPPEYAVVLAARLIVALVAGLGVASLASLALRNGVAITQCVLLFIVYLLFTIQEIRDCHVRPHSGVSN